MASYPTFDNRWFDSGVDERQVRRDLPDARSSGGPELDPDLSALTNRAIQGQYNLGSTFKPFTAYAALATGRLGPATTYNDQGTYKLTSIADDVCAQGVRCEFKNSTCPPVGGPCRYGTVNVDDALAVSSDAFFYSSARSSTTTPGTQLQDNVRLFGFGADTGIDLPFEFDGTVPDERAQGRARRARRAQPRTRRRTFSPATTCSWPSARACWRRRRCSSPSATRRSPTAASCCSRTSCRRSSQPETPDGDPGFADLSQATVVAADRARQSAPDPDAARDPRPDRERAAPHRHRARARTAATTTGEKLFADYPADAIQVAGKTGTAQGRQQLPVERLVGVRRVQHRSRAARTRWSPYLEKAGFGSTGAAPVVKCMFLALSGDRAARPGGALRAARHDVEPRRRAAPERGRHDCMRQHATPARIRPVD